MMKLDQKGQGLTEYLTLLLLISITCIAASRSLGGEVKKKLEEAKKDIASALSLENNNSSDNGSNDN